MKVALRALGLTQVGEPGEKPVTGSLLLLLPGLGLDLDPLLLGGLGHMKQPLGAFS